MQRRAELTLAGVLAIEVLLFGFAGTNFFTRLNFFEIIRLGVELGLLAIALTPVIITGGIDLSVGSTMGLSAVVFGSLWHDAGLPAGVAALLTLGAGVIAGSLNALPIAILRIPPLIVTLGTYSLYRGLAEGMTGGVVTYGGFPRAFQQIGQGYVGGVIPAQMFVLAMIAAGYWLLLHRSVIGRALYATGFNYDGARYAGPLFRRR